MLVFDQFELAAGLRLSARVERGKLHVVQLDPAEVHEDFVARYLSATARGELWLEEVRDASGAPVSLRSLTGEKLRHFFARFVGLVLRDGGLVETLTVRENLLLAFRYQQVWPGKPESTDAAIAKALTELTAHDSTGVANAAHLDCRPPTLNAFARRYWGFVKTLLRRPQLLIAVAPFDGLGVVAQRAIVDLLAHYRVLEPKSAHLLVLTGPHETAALRDLSWISLQPTARD